MATRTSTSAHGSSSAPVLSNGTSATCSPSSASPRDEISAGCWASRADPAGRWGRTDPHLPPTSGQPPVIRPVVIPGVSRGDASRRSRRVCEVDQTHVGEEAEVTAMLRQEPHAKDPKSTAGRTPPRWGLSPQSAATHPLSETPMSGRTPDSTIETAIQALVTLCFEDLMTGDWDELLDVADDALRLCESHGYSELRWPLWLASGSVAAARGQLPWAHELADRIERWGAVRGSADVQLYARLVRCQAAQASGDFDRAFREISVLGTASVFSAHLPLSLWASLDYVSCALRATRRDAAEAFVA